MMSHGWQVVFLMVMALAMTACGADKKKNEDGGPPRWQNYPVAIHTDPRAVPNQQAAEDFQQAMDFWETKVGYKMFDYRGNWNGREYDGGNEVSQNVLYLASSWTYASNIAAQTIVLSQKSEIKGAVIMVNPGTRFCGGDCAGQSTRTSMRKVYAHELGHFIGLGHSQDAANIMYPDALPGGDLTSLSVNVEELRPLVN